MKLRRKKKGSAFITIIVITAILFTTGTTMLTVTASDYKMRKIESGKIKNLYEADSGLNVVENIIIKTSQNAIRESDENIKMKFLSLKEEEKNSDKLNELFKEEFYNYLNQEVSEDRVILLEYLLENALYINDSNSETLEFIKADLDKDIKISINDGDYKSSDNGIEIKVTSSFKNEEEEIKNEKILQATFKIVAPNYNAKIYKVGIYPVFNNKVFTVDGNMEIQEGETNINGDIWVKGDFSKQESMDYVFDKYEGGIILDKTKLNLVGNIYTLNSFNLKDKVKESKVDGYVYANNLYVGKSSRDISSEDNKIEITKDLILNNDLALNSTNSNILIKENFYGINGKTLNSETADKAMNSSSIIVNDTLDTSSVTVEKDSYIMGVAYLDATDSQGNKYQTGESVSVKGNYLAYTDVGNLEDGVVLKYYSPLQLLENKNGDSSIKMKADYFRDYYNKDKSDTYSLNQGGVNLKGDVYSVGASIKNNEASTGNLNVEIEVLKLIGIKQEDFALNVLAMGDSTGISSLNHLYSSNTAFRTVENQIDFSQISSLKEKTIIKGDKGLILNENDKEKITIENNMINGNVIKKGLIITNGDIEIKGSFDFEGTIITSKNLYIIGNSTRTISYNGEIVREIIEENNEILERVFKSQTVKKKAEETKIISDINIQDQSKFLEVTEWKIIK